MIDGKINNLNEEEIKKVAKALQLKRDIMSYLDINEFIEKTRRIIDNSDIFEFRSNVARLYIDKKNPQFVLKIKDENLLNEILQKKNPRDEIAKLLQHEIIKNISELLTEALKKSNNNNLFEDIPEEITKFVLSNIYVIRANVEINNIQLFFFI